MPGVLLTLLVLELSAVPSDDVVKQFDELTYTYTGGPYKDEPFKYRLLKPDPIEPGQKYPLVLFLHGAGERGTDNKAQLEYLPELMAKPEHRRKYPCFLLAPQCPPRESWAGLRGRDLKPMAQGEPTDPMKAAIGMLEHVEKSYPVDARRIYLTGLSMGGYGSWDLAMRMPEKFAAVAPICGGGDEKQAEKLVKLPIWAFHGAEDSVVPVARSRSMIEAIKKAGGNPKYSELPGVEHDSWTPAYNEPSDLLPWMFEQRKMP
jgi:predicted peptidase